MEVENKNRVTDLRENHPFEGILGNNSMSLFQYCNSDRSVSEIRVHLNSVDGVIKATGVIRDPNDPKNSREV